MIQERIRPAAFKHVEAELYAFHDTKKEILRMREQIIFGSSNDDENIGGGRSSEPGRPTERIATRLTTNRRLRNLEEIEQAIESTLNMLDSVQLKMVKLKYFSRRRLSWQYIADECHIHEQTASERVLLFFKKSIDHFQLHSIIVIKGMVQWMYLLVGRGKNLNK